MIARFALVALVGVVYCAIIAFAPMLDRLVLFPSTARLNIGNASRTAIAFESGELEIWTATSQAAQRRRAPDIFILRFYGNADRADRWVSAEAEMWGDRAVEVWGVNYPGYGGSTGPARLALIGPAALAAYDVLKTGAGDRPIVVFGASLGTTAALHIAATRPVDAVILHNPPAMRQMILRQFGWWNAWLLAGPLALKIPADLDSVANAKRSRAPAVFLLAKQDEIVAPKYQKLVIDAYAGEKRVITLAGASHNSPLDETAIVAVRGAVDTLLQKARSPAATALVVQLSLSQREARLPR